MSEGETAILGEDELGREEGVDWGAPDLVGSQESSFRFFALHPVIRTHSEPALRTPAILLQPGTGLPACLSPIYITPTPSIRTRSIFISYGRSFFSRCSCSLKVRSNRLIPTLHPSYMHTRMLRPFQHHFLVLVECLSILFLCVLTIIFHFMD